jgi:hypothetical protein
MSFLLFEPIKSINVEGQTRKKVRTELTCMKQGWLGPKEIRAPNYLLKDFLQSMIGLMSEKGNGWAASLSFCYQKAAYGGRQSTGSPK